MPNVKLALDGVRLRNWPKIESLKPTPDDEEPVAPPFVPRPKMPETPFASKLLDCWLTTTTGMVVSIQICKAETCILTGLVRIRPEGPILEQRPTIFLYK